MYHASELLSTCAAGKNHIFSVIFCFYLNKFYPAYGVATPLRFILKCKREFFKEPRKMVIAIVGAGGKTTALYCLGHELTAMGRRVLLTTTTKICRPDDIPLYLGPPDRLRPVATLMAAASGMADARKLAGYSAGDIGVVASLGLFDDILVEADGAARKPIKSPNDTEPVYPQPLDLIIGVIGLDSLGQPATDDTVHRLPLFTGVTGASAGEPITASHVLALIEHENGLFRHAPAGVPRIVFLNKYDKIDENTRRQAEQIVRNSPYPALLTGHGINWTEEFFRRFMPELYQLGKGECYAHRTDTPNGCQQPDCRTCHRH